MKNTNREAWVALATATLVGLSVSGALGRWLAAAGVSPDAVQLTDSILGLATLGMVGVGLLAQRREARLAAERITVVFVHGDETCVLPFRVRREAARSRSELFGFLGALSARRNNLGGPLLRALESDRYDRMLAGFTSEFYVPVADATEFAAIQADCAAYGSR